MMVSDGYKSICFLHFEQKSKYRPFFGRPNGCAVGPPVYPSRIGILFFFFFFFDGFCLTALTSKWPSLSQPLPTCTRLVSPRNRPCFIFRSLFLLRSFPPFHSNHSIFSNEKWQSILIYIFPWVELLCMGIGYYARVGLLCTADNYVENCLSAFYTGLTLFVSLFISLLGWLGIFNDVSPHYFFFLSFFLFFFFSFSFFFFTNQIDWSNYFSIAVSHGLDE